MIRKPAFVLALAVLCLAAPSSNSAIGFGESDKLDPAFCDMKALRQTVVYVDDMIMVDGKINWADRLNSKLTASLVPGEPVTIVRLSPGEGRSKEIWSGCWPDYSADQAEKIANGVYVLQRNPLGALKDQQALFVRFLGAAEGAIYTEGKRPKGVVDFPQNKPPKKQLLRALASDDGRYSNSMVPIRAIVYSDMAENSDLGSVFVPPPAHGLDSIGPKLGTHLVNGVFYLFGVDEDVTGAEIALEKSSKAFWTGALRGMTAVVVGFGSDLTTPNLKPISAGKYDISMKYKGQSYSGNVSLLADHEGNVIDSWIRFTRLGVAGLAGSYHCSPEACKIDATLSGHLVSTDSESITLNGTPTSLTGEIRTRGRAYPLEATQTGK